MSEQLIKELIAIILGVTLFIFRRTIVRTSMESQTKTFGFRYSQKEINSGIAFTILVSILMIGAAIISMLKISSFRL